MTTPCGAALYIRVVLYIRGCATIDTYDIAQHLLRHRTYALIVAGDIVALQEYRERQFGVYSEVTQALSEGEDAPRTGKAREERSLVRT
ncbi:hypothetical protein NDU88_001024 [Pleurodeles waltl]|uniref:Uncharacterized protein n=1 Tax=Pleurodeles waltl TaxID=8319 RepID=A0AAV7LA42_PLEWA|nr:hypothetical protein NDU88_001024 [Pleurodeles waltl]